MADIGNIQAELTADMSQLRRSLDKAEGMLRGYERTTDKRLDRAEDRWTRYGRKVRATTQTMTNSIMSLQGAMAGIGGALIVRDIIKKGAQFEHTMTEVKGIAQATREEFKLMEAEAKELGATTEWSASQAGEGLKFLSMAGFEAKESVDALSGVLDLATAGNIELGRAADIASNALTAMQLETSELGRVNDTFVGTITSSNVNMEMMAESFKYAGSVGSSFGYEIEEISAMIGQLGNAGIQGSMAGTQLAMAFQKTGEVFEEYGVNAEESEKYTNDLMGAMKLLEDRGASASEIMDIFGQRAGRGVAALLGIGSEAIEDYIDKIQEAEGASGDLADTMRSSTINQFKELRAAIEAVEIEIFERRSSELNETIKAITKSVRENEDAIASWAGETGDVFTALTWVMDTMQGFGRVIRVVGRLGALTALQLQKQFLEVAETIVNGPIRQLNNMIALYNKIPALPHIGELDYTGFGAGIADEIEITKQAIEEGREDIENVLMEPFAGREMRKSLEEVQSEIKESSETVDKSTDSTQDHTAVTNKNTDAQRRNAAAVKENAEARQGHLGSMDKQIDSVLKENASALANFEKDYQKATMSSTEYEVDQIEKRYNHYDKYVKDKAKLNEWVNAELVKVMDQGTDKQEEQTKGTIDTMENAFNGWASSYSGKLNDMLWESEFTFDKIGQSFGKMITEQLIQSAMKDFSGALFGDGGEEGGGIVGTIVDGVMDAFSSSDSGSSGSGGSGGSSGMWGSIANWAIGAISSYDDGGRLPEDVYGFGKSGRGYRMHAGETVQPTHKQQDTGQRQEKSEIKVKNINVLDPSVVGDYLATSEGEQVIMNVVEKNRG